MLKFDCQVNAIDLEAESRNLVFPTPYTVVTFSCVDRSLEWLHNTY
jgi:hypothetical protein